MCHQGLWKVQAVFRQSQKKKFEKRSSKYEQIRPPLFDKIVQYNRIQKTSKILEISKFIHFSKFKLEFLLSRTYFIIINKRVEFLLSYDNVNIIILVFIKFSF